MLVRGMDVRGGVDRGSRLAQAETVNTELALLAKVRSAGAPDAVWTELCKTPGPVVVPEGQELALEPVDRPAFGDAKLEQMALDSLART